jgi:hypothetical protein
MCAAIPSNKASCLLALTSNLIVSLSNSTGGLGGKADGIKDVYEASPDKFALNHPALFTEDNITI